MPLSDIEITKCYDPMGWGPMGWGPDLRKAARAIESAATASLLAQIAPFAPYLKDGETPIERLERECKDNAALLGLMAKDRERIAQLEAQLAEARKDAERYTVLRNGSNWPAVFNTSVDPEPLRGDDLDAAIDAAIAQERQNTEVCGRRSDWAAELNSTTPETDHGLP